MSELDTVVFLLNFVGNALKYNLLDQNPVLRLMGFVENCNDHNVHWSFDGLEKHIFGQELALEKLRSVLETLDRHPRMISIHGGAGTGKTHTFRILRDKIYFAKKSKTYYYKYFSGNEFEYSSFDENAKLLLVTEIKRAAACRFSMIVFDEADQFPPGFLYEILYDIIRSGEYKEGPGPVFIFISNVGAEEILSGFIDGVNHISYYEDLLKKAMQHKKDSFSTSQLVKGGHIKHFIPFLPLDEFSIEYCIQDALSKRWLNDPSRVQKIKDQIIFKYTSGYFFYKRFSEFGCKNIENEINLLKYRDEL